MSPIGRSIEASAGVTDRRPLTLRRGAVGVLALVALALLPACGLAGDSSPTAGSDATGGPATSAPTTTTTAAPTTTTAPPTATTAPTTTTPAPPTTTTTAPPTTTTTAPPPPAPAAALGPGDEGEPVAALQQRLSDLRFWVGDVDGVYGLLTEQAVFAFQKANGMVPDGVVGASTRQALDQPQVPDPQSTEGRVMEVDKGRQLLYAVLYGELQWVFHTSTGTEEPYRHPGGYTAMADTPPGRHVTDWQFDGWRDGRLGRMYRPKYFHSDGIAVHGYHAVPPYPASHGCVRVTMAAMDHIWSHDLMPIGSTVLVYGETPAPGPAV